MSFGAVSQKTARPQATYLDKKEREKNRKNKPEMLLKVLFCLVVVFVLCSWRCCCLFLLPCSIFFLFTYHHQQQKLEAEKNRLKNMDAGEAEDYKKQKAWATSLEKVRKRREGRKEEEMRVIGRGKLKEEEGKG